MRRVDWDTYFMALATTAATRSTCPRRHVGCVIVKKNYVISTGYNGSKPGEPHCDDIGCLMVDGSCKRTIHAEDNALRRTSWLKRAGSSLYCTDMPCENCARLIAKKGIIEVVYKNPYAKTQDFVFDFFGREGIVIRRYDLKEAYHEVFDGE